MLAMRCWTAAVSQEGSSDSSHRDIGDPNQLVHHAEDGWRSPLCGCEKDDEDDGNDEDDEGNEDDEEDDEDDDDDEEDDEEGVGGKTGGRRRREP
jgi:hypothetical protein